MSRVQLPAVVRAGMSAASFVLGSVLWALVLGLLTYLYVFRGQQADQGRQSAAGAAAGAASAEGAGQSEGAQAPDDAVVASTKTVKISFPTRQLPAFEFPECQGGVVSLDSLKGRRWLASFVFTRCVTTCPVITREISLLHKRVAQSNPDFVFVTFSVDSSYDTAEVLRKYGETFQADPVRWKFLTGDEQSIHDLIRRGFVQYVQPNLGAERKPGFEVAHTNRAVLVNEAGLPVATYLMTVPEDVVKLRRVIEGREEFPKPGPLLTTESTGENPDVQLNLLPAVEGDAEKSGASEPKAGGAGAGGAGGDVAGGDERAGADGAGGAGTAAGVDPGAGCESPEVDPEADADAEQTQQSGVGERSAESVGADPAAVAVTGETASADERVSGAVVESAAEQNRAIDEVLPDWVKFLPTLNAALNSLCFCLLLAGYVLILRGRKVEHRNCMIAAFVVSVVFLGCYLTYHEALHAYTGRRGRAFVGSDLARWLYFSILIPHVLLAAAVPVLALRVFWLAWRERWVQHRRLARVTLPIWGFVSVTGVVIYWMLYHWPWSTMAPTAIMPGNAI
jgi:uncharacterized membrane protein YozB (DUF420 family)/cytochrome oxidase Cu insertion factor (SCO1/SenC/PrrC family)